MSEPTLATFVEAVRRERGVPPRYEKRGDAWLERAWAQSRDEMAMQDVFRLALREPEALKVLIARGLACGHHPTRPCRWCAEELRNRVRRPTLEEITVAIAASLAHSACVVARRGDRFACIRSAKHGGAVELPGGRGEPGETPEQTARRELREEVGLAAQTLTLLLRAPVGGYDAHLYVATPPTSRVAWPARPAWGELRSSTEGEAFWATRDELLTGTYAEHTRAWLPLLDATPEAAHA